MPLKDVLQAALDEWGWDDEIEYNVTQDKYYVATTYQFEEQVYRLEISAHEADHLFRCTIISPIAIPASRSADAAVLLNTFNQYVSVNHFELDDDGTIISLATVDVEDVEASPAMITNLRNAVGMAFWGPRIAAIASLAFSKTAVGEIIQTYLETAEAQMQARAAGMPAQGASH